MKNKLTDEERKESRRLSSLKYYNKNKEKINKKLRENNEIKVKKRLKNSKLTETEKSIRYEYNKQYRQDNKEKIKEQRKLYRQTNKEVIRERKRLYCELKRKSDKLFKLKENTRTLINNSFKNKNFKKKYKTEQIIGCSLEYLKLHLENNFEAWMSWENHGKYNGELNYGWDIDHIIPLASANTEEDIIRLNHYTNLQPLCCYINRNIKK